MSEQPRALGKPYDASADQPIAGVEWPAPENFPSEGASSDPQTADLPVAEPADTLAERIAAVDAPAPASAGGAPWRIDIGNDAEATRSIRRALVAGAIPDTYARRGELVQVTEVAGISEGELPYVSARTLDPHALRRLLGKHAFAYRMKPKKTKIKGDDGKPVELVTFDEIEAVPTVNTCRDLLSETEWQGVPALRGVSLVPILRPDGTLVQTRGYDEATATYYAPQLDIGHIPARPTDIEVQHAREFVLDDVLGDFPWVDKGDKANYLALLITPILRPYLRGPLVPMGAISAASWGTGKTLLAGDIPQALYGITSRPWVGDEAEVRKSVSTVLTASTKPVVLFDNVPEGEAIKSATLAKLLTSQQWDDRELGKNGAGSGIEAINDRLWLATGNAMAFGGDMPSRTVLVRLDANMARPDLRDPSQFKIPDLQGWLTNTGNAAELLRQIMILIMDWVATDRPAPRPYTMRQYTRWATPCGDFLTHHGVPLFLDNMDALSASNEEAGEWLAFLSEWYERFGSTPKTAREVAQSAERTWTPETGEFDPWGGRYLTDGRGKPRNNVSLGIQLRAHKGKVFAAGTVGGYKIESPDKLERDNVRRYHVILMNDEGEPAETPAAETPDEAPDEAPAAAPAYTPSLFDDDDESSQDG